MNKKALSLLIVAVMLLSIAPAVSYWAPVGASPTSPTSIQENKEVPSVSQAHFIPGDELKKEIQHVLMSHKKTVRLIVAPDRKHAMEVYHALSKLGRIDPISKPEYQFIVVEMPISKVPELNNIPGILHVWEDRTVKLEEPKPLEPGMTSMPQANLKKPDMFLSVYTTHAYNTWVNYGVLGDNVTVAVLDTGVDVGHPFLQTTLDGRRKIIDVYDDSDEGIAQIYYETNTTNSGYITVNMTVPVYWGAYAQYYGHQTWTNYNMTTYYVGNITGSEYYLGLLPERYFDLNNFNGTPYDPYHLGLFGDLSDVYPVLVVNESGNIVAYIDFDLDNNFTNDQPMGLYDITGDYVQVNTTKVDVAFARFGIVNTTQTNLTGGWPVSIYLGVGIGYAMFMWDSFGHGTHVSGTIAGVGLPTDPVFHGVYGMAPNAQLMEVKVLAGEGGFGMISWIINGMFYAALHGADIISMSLGGLATYNDGLEDPTNFYVDLISDWFGVTFSIAAGNDGPTLNTVGAPGDSDLAITVGAYRSSLRWQIFFGVDGVANTVASFSSRGPRMDGLIDPDVIAPGELIFSSLPLYYTVLYNNPYRYYGIWDGTSMATPHVSGAAALLISYAKQHGLNYNPLMIRRALEMSAEPVEEATPIDEGAGLIQVDKALQDLIQLSNQPTTYIYGGTTFTSFKNPIEQPLIPVSPAYVEFNGYFQAMFGLPYLYRGVYIRNEFPGSVPLYFYPLEYVPGYGLNYTATPKVYKISTNVDWITINQTQVVAGGNKIGSLTINIDYNKLGKSGVYVGYVYIDDPDTSYVDGYIPVIVTFPMNSNGQTHTSLSDTALPGVAKHYFVQVPRGTKELKVTLEVPNDTSGTPMGRTTMMIAKPDGTLVEAYVPGTYFVGAGGPSKYTWVITDPTPGTWDLTAYTSTFTKARTGYNESHYKIEVSLGSVSIDPELILKDSSGPGNVSVSAVVKNNLGTLNAKVVGYGVGRLDQAYGMIREVNQSEWDVIGAFKVTQDVYFIRFGITQPQVANADLDLYVYYFPTLNDLLNFANYTLYTDQIGPTSDEVFERFMPKSGYYLVAVYGYDTVGYNPIQYVFYYQILGDNGNVKVTTGPFKFTEGTSHSIGAIVSIPDNGTYLGVLGLLDANTNETLTYAPMILQAGQPEMLVVTGGKAVLGQESLLHVMVFNKTSMKLVKSPVKVIVDGRPYYTVNGEVNVTFIPTTLGQITFKIHVESDEFKDVDMMVTLPVQEPVRSTITRADAAKAFLAGSGSLVTKKPKVTMVEFNDGYMGAVYKLTADGPTGEMGYVLLALPTNAKIYQFKRDQHVIKYWVLKGNKATYLLALVEYASPVTFTVTIKLEPTKVQPDFNVFNYLYNRWYQNKLSEFNKLYQKALNAGVNETILQQALTANQTASEYYQKALDLAGGNIFLHLGDFRLLALLRNAYVAESTAVKILKEALGE